jgi:hypothetical protein
MHFRVLVPAFVLVFASAFLTACPRRIGDGCATSTECSINGDRFCDISALGGYCTMVGCDSNTCPDNALCIEFYSDSNRLVRRFCMAACNSDSDCRGQGYQCVRPTVTDPNASCPAVDPDAGASAPLCTKYLDTDPNKHPLPPGPNGGFCTQTP